MKERVNPNKGTDIFRTIQWWNAKHFVRVANNGLTFPRSGSLSISNSYVHSQSDSTFYKVKKVTNS